MADEPTPSDRPSVRTPRQQRIHRRLGLVGEGPQSFFDDILRLVNGEVNLASASNIAGHLLRELESALRDALEPVTQHIDAALKETQAKSPEAEKPSHPSQIRAILKALAISETEGIGADWLDIATGDIRPHQLAHRTQFNRPSPLDSQFLDVWDRFEPVLNVVLEQFEARYAELYKPVDALLVKPVPSRENLQYLGQYLPNNPVIRFHFFENLTHPGWLRPLRDRGYFSTPPPATTNHATGTVSFAAWAPPTYLQKMAALAECQQDVLEIVVRVPDNDNIYVLDGLVKVVAALPPDLAAQAVPKLINLHAVVPAFGLTPERLAELAVRLTNDGHLLEGLQLLRAVLALRGEEMKSLSGRNRRRTSPQIEEYQYSQVLQKQVPKVLALAPDSTFELLIELLDEALRIDEVDSAGDLSWIWRRSIDQANRGSRYEVKDLLIDAVRDAALKLCEADPQQLKTVVAEFEAKANSVWHRLALFLLARMPESALDLVEERLRQKTRFDDWRQNAEYAQVLASAFDILRHELQAEILGWIDAGPPPDYFDGMMPEVAAASKKGWQFRRLRILKGKLSEEWEQRLIDVTPTEGEEEPEDGAIWVGPTSPLTTAELQAIPVEQVAAYLREWSPGSSWHGPSAEGLGRVLSTVVAVKPAEFAKVATQFVGLDPTLVRSFLQGLIDALKESKLFDWNPVLELCEWARTQAREPLGTAYRVERDPGWSWCHRTVARLVTSGMDSETHRIPIALRDRIWRLIEPLTWDPDPAPDRDADRAPESGYDLAINSVRGDGVIAAIRYGVWVKKALPIDQADAMAAMPELRDCLEQHLDPARESSIAIWAVVGASLPLLQWLDREWVKANLVRILPEAKPLREAVWFSYLKWNRPYDGVFSVLRPAYEANVAILTPDDPEPKFESAQAALVHHLMTFYWRGAEGAEDLVDMFLRQASAPYKQIAVDFIGRSLADTRESIPPDTVERLSRLWERILCNAETANPANRSSLEPFGWWLTSGAMDLDWSLRQAVAVLEAGAVLEPDHVVVDYLEKLAKDRPVETARILGGICDNIVNEWSVHGWADHAMTVLRAVLASGNADAIKEGRAVISKLVARGYSQFKQLS